MHRLTTLIVTGLTLVLLPAGCGNSDPKPVRAPLTAITHSRAHSIVSLLTIRQADLPEFKVTASATAQESQHAASEVRCAGHRLTSSRRQSWASAKSEQILANSGYQALAAWSETAIMPTAAKARREIAEAARLQVCMEHALRTYLLRSHFLSHVRGITVEPVAASVKGADASTAYRTIVAARGAPVIVYLDTILFSYGQDVFALGAYHFSKPVPPAMEERLQSLLIARAKSHSR